jgi:hypothetical protein
MRRKISGTGPLVLEAIAEDMQAFNKKKGRGARVVRGGPSIDGKVCSLHRANCHEAGGTPWMMEMEPLPSWFIVSL